MKDREEYVNWWRVGNGLDSFREMGFGECFLFCNRLVVRFKMEVDRYG